MGRKIKSMVILAAGVVFALYVCDFIRMWIVVRRGGDAFGTVQVENFAVVPEKNNKVEFFYNPPETVECAHSLFSQYGDPPCWYAGRSHEKRTDL